MRKKKRRIRIKNGIAKALAHRSFKQQVVPDKRRRIRATLIIEEGMAQL